MCIRERGGKVLIIAEGDNKWPKYGNIILDSQSVIFQVHYLFCLIIHLDQLLNWQFDIYKKWSGGQ